MREESQRADLVEELTEEWRPQRFAWPNPTDDLAPEFRTESSEDSLASQTAALDRAITICVTKGRSVRTTHRLTKPRASIGKIGGDADMQIDDPGISSLHCAVAITESGIRLYDLDSVNGTYVDDERIQIANLNDHSAFRIGSTEFIVSIVSNHNLRRTGRVSG
jgi:pSer/pThr/pTyr-binding forkhead associated (FHA) protein